MDTNNDQPQPVPVPVTGKEQVVLSIPAQPKPKPPWWKRGFGELMVIWGCGLLAIWIWVNP